MTAQIVHASTRQPLVNVHTSLVPRWMKRAVGTKIKGQLWDRLAEAKPVK